MDKNKINVYSVKQQADIKSEFLRVKENCYLDHAGATLYSEKQLQLVYSDLSSNIYANPHARNTSSQSTADAIDIVRYLILSHFNTSQEEYSVIFTSGATHALKVIAETFDFNGGTLAYLEDNHTSVLGMRTFAPNFQEVKLAEAFNILSQKYDFKTSPWECEKGKENSLFVYPAQSNFAGTKYPLYWIESVKHGALEKCTHKHQKWFVVLDAASFVSTSELDLSKHKPDFVSISFYKIFGYPTGLGALLVRKSAEDLLKKKYLGGGTVLMAMSCENVMIPRPTLHERFEDGTLSYISILAIKHGFVSLKRLNLTPNLISSHTFQLAKYTFKNLLALHHFNGEPVTVFYHDTSFDERKTQGGIINFNLKRCSGEYVGYAEVLHIANLHEIHLRTGCFCNPGACQKFLNLTSNDIKRQFEAGHVCGDQNDLVDGYPTGSVRISFGYMSTYEDADRFLNMIENCFVTKPVVKRELTRMPKRSFIMDKANSSKILLKTENENQTFVESRDSVLDLLSTDRRRKVSGTLKNIFLYPVKSCGAYSVENSWELTRIGLKYDRRWMIINAAGSCVSQKQIKKLCLIKPLLQLLSNELILTFNGSEVIHLPLDSPNAKEKNAYFCDSKVCGDKIQGFDCGDEVAEWLSEKLVKPGLRLLRQCDFSEYISGRSSQTDQESLLSLANKAQYLLVNLASIRWLKEHIPVDDVLCRTLDSILLRFRANFVVEFDIPFVENELENFQFGDILFKFSGNCTRCQMICIDQETGDISKEPLQTLSREMKGKICFGIYLYQYYMDKEKCVKVGAKLKASFK